MAAQGSTGASYYQGRVIGVPARSYIYTTIQCTNANYSTATGPLIYPWDQVTGLSLHFRYDANAKMNFRGSSTLYLPPPAAPGIPDADYVPEGFSVEFDSPGVFTVPFDGTLTLLGGNLGNTGQAEAQFKVWVYYDDRLCSGRPADPISTSNYAPMFHWLKHYPNPITATGTTFFVPDNHTYLLTQNSTYSVLVNGVMAQPGTNSPGLIVSPGDMVEAATPNNAQTLMTGWLG